MADDPPVFTLWRDFVGWMLKRTDAFPKTKRFSFALRIENLVLEILQDIVRASYSSIARKSEYLDNIALNLSVLRVLLRVAMEQKYMAYRSYEFALKKIEEAGRMIGGWQKFVDEKKKTSL